jgi:hypothetical protein
LIGTRARSRAWPRSPAPLSLAAVALLACLAAPPDSAGAAATRGITLGFADARYSSPDPATRTTWFDHGVEAGAELARISVSWRAVARTRPTAPTDPASPEYRFGRPDAAIREAAASGQSVLLTVSIAPAWAEGAGRPSGELARSGTWKPDPAALADFTAAVAARYSGGFADPLYPGRYLPKVSRFEIWNEPNLAANLTPQLADGRRVAPEQYRGMLNAAYAAIHAVQPGATVVGGALASIGSVQPGGARSTGPLPFLRQLLCVGGVAGQAKVAQPCGRPVRLDVLSHHPINIREAPRQPAVPGDAGIIEMDDVTAMLRAAEAAGTVPGGKHPVWATEFWWYSNSPLAAERRTALLRQARYIEEGIYLLWEQGIKVAVLYQLGDEPGNPFQTGILFSDGRPKPSQTSFSFPLVGDRRSERTVRVWGRAPEAGSLRIVAAPDGGRWTTRKAVRVSEGEVFLTRISLAGPGSIRATVGRARSLIWDQAGGASQPAG